MCLPAWQATRTLEPQTDVVEIALRQLSRVNHFCAFLGANGALFHGHCRQNFIDARQGLCRLTESGMWLSDSSRTAEGCSSSGGPEQPWLALG